jgi:hypothetical protein
MKITDKIVQTHECCTCGFNRVYQDFLPIKWRDLNKYNIKRKTDHCTGETFLMREVVIVECPGDHFIDD